MKNKRVKQMIVDVALQGRKAIWYGEESEVFAAKSHEQVEKHFQEQLNTEDTMDDNNNITSKNWRYWWTPCVNEKEYKNGKYITKGTPAKSKSTGVIMKEFERLPLICNVYGDESCIAQVSTSYN